jgi:hypothetical protein
MAARFSDPANAGTFGNQTEYRRIFEDRSTLTSFVDKGDGKLRTTVTTCDRQ